MITNFKEYMAPKYKVGDYVRIVGNKGDWKSKPYKIVRIGDFSKDELYNQISLAYLLDTIVGGYIWRKEENLEYVPDYEIEADKYNL